MAKYEGCGVCMKVCPIQRYGMEPVMKHYVETGEVLGKNTDNLEGYAFEDRGGYFGPGQLPKFDTEFFEIPKGVAKTGSLTSSNKAFLKRVALIERVSLTLAPN